MKKLILDMDSSVSGTYGQQEGSMYNGHFARECYHPLFIFNHDRDVEQALLRGTVFIFRLRRSAALESNDEILPAHSLQT